MADGTLNHLYLKDDGTGTSNTTGTQPADTVKIGTATTSGGAVTSVNILRDSGRQAKVRSESLVPGGPAAGNPASINLAAWAAAAANSVTVYGTLPTGALPAIAFDDLSDVTLTSQARGDIVYRGASAWLNLAAGTAGQILQTNGAGADPSWVNSAAGSLSGLSDVSLSGTAQGDLLYRGAATWNNLAHGTSGQYLVTQGVGANPIWQTLPTTILGDVTLAPASGTRNDIQPTADVTMLRLLARVAGQTNDLLQVLDTSSVAQARILSSGLFSSPHGTNAERFGKSSSASGTEATAFGYIAQATGDYSLAIGTNAAASQQNATAVGRYTVASGLRSLAMGPTAVSLAIGSIAIGSSADAESTDGIAIGESSVVNGINGICIGAFSAVGVAGVTTSNASILVGRGGSVTSTAGANTCLGYQASDGGFASVVCLGAGATATAANQLVIGGANSQNLLSITNAYLGKGVTHATPAGVTINATGGSGSDIAGASLTLAGGKATGNVAGGDVIFQSTRSGQGSASTLRSLEELLRLSNAGVLTFTQHTSTSDRSALDVTPTWATSTDASRKARSVFNIWDTAAREALRLEASGSAAMLGFLGASAIARPSSYTLAGSATRTMPTDPSSSYSGQDNLQAGSVYAKSADLETLRGVVSSLEGVIRQLLIDLASTSGYGLLAAA